MCLLEVLGTPTGWGNIGTHALSTHATTMRNVLRCATQVPTQETGDAAKHAGVAMCKVRGRPAWQQSDQRVVTDSTLLDTCAQDMKPCISPDK